jgi:putative redox protein
MKRFREQLVGAKDPSETISTNKAVARLVEDQYSEAKVGNFNLIQDEPESVNGGNRGPTPTGYFTAAIATCENVLFARNAALHNLSIDSLETTVTGHWDRRGLFELEGMDPSYTDIAVETSVKTKDTVQKVLDVARITHRTCPIHATLRKATKLSFRLLVNGIEVPL